ncbi:MAG TPA: LacI family DNA-binding transcriptional regulator [Anaerovoracaceae bacterium]|nr:LacI family DNA-binding transcriptional regulator [Anaerovoracaceae bacterium]
MGQATIKKIAELANVSRGTVDRVLHERQGVKPDVRQRVLEIAEALNYTPNLIGRSLANLHDDVSIGIVLSPQYNPFIKDILKGVRAASDEFKPFGFNVIVKVPDTLDPSEQLEILDQLEEQGISGISMIPLDTEAIRNKLNELDRKGIPIVTFNSPMSGINDLCFVGQDHICGGTCAGGLMGKLLPDGGKVAMIISSHNLTCHQERLSGFNEKLSACHPDLEVVEIAENADRDDLAFQRTFQFVQNYPDLAGIYIAGGGILGLGQALKATEKAGKIKVICHDFIDDAVRLLKDGTIDFAIGQNPERQGYLLVSLLFDYLVKKEMPPVKFVEMPVEIATGDSLKLK